MNKPDLDIRKIQFPSLRFERYYFKTRFPPNWSFIFFFIDIKMCLKVIGNYGKSFMVGLIPGQNRLNFPNFLKKKTENLVLSAWLLSIFFLIKRNDFRRPFAKMIDLSRTFENSNKEKVHKIGVHCICLSMSIAQYIAHWKCTHSLWFTRFITSLRILRIIQYLSYVAFAVFLAIFICVWDFPVPDRDWLCLAF